MTWGQLKRGPACHCRQPVRQDQSQGRREGEWQDRGQTPLDTSHHPAETWETPRTLSLGGERQARAKALTDSTGPPLPNPAAFTVRPVAANILETLKKCDYGTSGQDGG